MKQKVDWSLLFRSILIVSVTFSISYCAFGKIVVIQDDLTGKTIVNLKMRHKDKDSYNYAVVDYIKELKGTKYDLFRLLISSIVSRGGINFDSKAILKIGDEQVDVKLSKQTNYSKTKAEVKKNSDSNSTSSSSSTTYFVTAEMLLNPKYLDKIAKANSFLIRVYYGSKPFTYILDESDLSKLKKFVSTTEEQQ